MKNYLKTLTKDEQAKLAKRCGTSVAYLMQIAGGHRTCGESLAINLERESRGAITCEELRPDVDWHYLRTTKPAA